MNKCYDFEVTIATIAMQAQLMRVAAACLLIAIFSVQTEAALPDSLASDSSSAESHSVPSHVSFVLDPGLTMISGAENILALHYLVSHTEEDILGTQWFSEESFLGKAGGILARFSKYAILDVPIDYFSVVFAHEYYGHGARYRELDIGNIHYAFNLPPPYGKGGGEASVGIPANAISQHEFLGIWEGGIEVHALSNRGLGLRWMSMKSMHYREALQYFWSWQIKFRYIQEAVEDQTTNVADDDPRAYIRILNKDNGYTDPANPRLSVSKMKSQVMLDLVNPFVVFALYTGLKTYLWDGSSSSEFPTIRLGHTDYLPIIRTGFTPFGLEYHLENYLSIGNVTSLIDIRLGDETFHKSWGGVGLALQNIYSLDRFSTDLYLEVWKQSKLKFGSFPSNSKGGGFGGAFSVRGHYDLTESRHPLAAVVELGYKSVGFVEGYQFGASLLVKIGIGITL